MRIQFARLGALLALLSLVFPLSAQTTTRPIADFVSAQGTFCFPDGMGGCLVFVPPVPNFLGFVDFKTSRSMSVDYAGLANAWLVSNGGASLGTTTAGTVIERPLPDGRAEVTVLLHTQKALTWVAAGLDFVGPLLFGHRAPDVPGGADAALGGSMLQVVFINTGPGAMLPDLMQLFFFPLPGQGVGFLAVRAQADGTLRAAFGVPDGTPGRAEENQTGLFMTGSRALSPMASPWSSST